MSSEIVARFDFYDADGVALFDDEIQFLLALAVVVMQGDTVGRQRASHKIFGQRAFVDINVAVHHFELQSFQQHSAEQSGIDQIEFVEFSVFRGFKGQFKSGSVEGIVGDACIDEPLRWVFLFSARRALFDVGEDKTFVLFA